MKRIFLSLTLILSVIYFGCGKSNDNQNTSSNTTNSSTNSSTPQNNTPQSNQPSGQASEEKTTTQNNTQTQTQQQNTSSGRDASGAIIVKFPIGATQVTLNGKIKGFGEQIAYVFEVSKGQKLTASVAPVPADGNIRIGQIISPSGNSDGPFGNKMTYDLNEAGNWKLVLSENQMAGDPWEGTYNLTIGIK